MPRLRASVPVIPVLVRAPLDSEKESPWPLSSDDARAKTECLRILRCAVEPKEANVAIYDLLHREHEQVLKNGETLLHRGNMDRTQVERLFYEMKMEMALHNAAEEDVFYARVRARRDVDAMHEGYGEHERLLQLLEEVNTLPVDSDGFRNKFRLLLQAFRAHVQHEETRIHRLAREVFDDNLAEELERTYLTRKEQLRTELFNPRKGASRSPAAQPVPRVS